MKDGCGQSESGEENYKLWEGGEQLLLQKRNEAVTKKEQKALRW